MFDDLIYNKKKITKKIISSEIEKDCQEEEDFEEDLLKTATPKKIRRK